MPDAGTVVLAEEGWGTVRKVTVAWTSSAGGAADLQTTNPFSGKCFLLTTVPSGGGTAPTDLYDITALDEDGVDILAGAGANRATATVQQVLDASLGGIAQDRIYWHVTNAGNAKVGTIYLLLR